MLQTDLLKLRNTSRKVKLREGLPDPKDLSAGSRARRVAEIFPSIIDALSRACALMFSWDTPGDATGGFRTLSALALRNPSGASGGPSYLQRVAKRPLMKSVRMLERLGGKKHREAVRELHRLGAATFNAALRICCEKGDGSKNIPYETLSAIEDAYDIGMREYADFIGTGYFLSKQTGWKVSPVTLLRNSEPTLVTLATLSKRAEAELVGQISSGVLRTDGFSGDIPVGYGRSGAGFRIGDGPSILLDEAVLKLAATRTRQALKVEGNKPRLSCPMLYAKLDDDPAPLFHRVYRWLVRCAAEFGPHSEMFAGDLRN